MRNEITVSQIAKHQTTSAIMVSHCLLSLVLFLCVVVSSNAFTAVVVSPSFRHNPVTTSSSLSMKFLKDLGFDKPSWLPNFGGDKKEGDDTTAAEDATVNADEKAASEGEPVEAKEE